MNRRGPFLLAGLLILGTALAVLLLFGDQPTIAGIAPEGFGHLAQLTALALVIGSAVLLGRQHVSFKAWAAVAWLAAVVALVAGYRMVVGGW